MTHCNPVEEEVADLIYETVSEDGDITIHAHTLDGRILWITKPNPTKIIELKKAELVKGRYDPKINGRKDDPTSYDNRRRKDLNRKPSLMHKVCRNYNLW